ncbi:50S ribosomal protein L3 [Candidatus Woesearchaeota archaeon]|nr:50S ribosomal protein L3 [Candidatus Woesearchaeota archaeon]MBW3016568.1 50S ribosomal protein L3 [Candidatus Woesearchaeota archaeon]
MPTKRTPRKGSMQYWPRRRAADIVARIRNWQTPKEAKLSGFAGYKVGMTHVIISDNKSTSITKGMDVQVPVTILECPPLKIASILLYKKDAYGTHCTGQINAEKLDKETARKIPLQKKAAKKPETKDIQEVRILAYTQPKLTTIGKKKPEFFEIGIGGKPEEKLTYAQGLLGKEIKITDVFSEGQTVDITSITKGKGTQGPVKRFGLNLRSHKSEKTKRGPGSLGPWHGPRTYRAPHAGQMGYHQRTDRNKQIMKIDEDTAKINAKGGFLRYGLVKNQYILIKGSVGGAHKRLITLTLPRHSTQKTKEASQIIYTSISSRQ